MNNPQQKSKTVGRVSPAGVTRQTNGHDVVETDNVGLRLSPNPTYGAELDQLIRRKLGGLGYEF